MKSGELVAEVITHTVDTPRLDRPRSSGVRATPLKRGIALGAVIGRVSGADLR